MSLWSKQKIFCNACGKELFVELPREVYGGKYRCCSMACAREMNWRDILSTLGKEYYAKPLEDLE